MNKKIADNYIISLLAKPFVVLTGNSGTGKTRIAIKVAEELEKSNYEIQGTLPIKIDNNGKIRNKDEEEIRDLCLESNLFVARVEDKEFEVHLEMNTQVDTRNDEFWDSLNNEDLTEIELIAAFRTAEQRHTLIPVGADWTDTRNLLGYVNPFGPEGKTVYEIPSMLEMILKALHPDNKKLPHFIILDEMNLSHVERYFSAFLSVMEANRTADNEKSIPLIGLSELEIIKETLEINDSVDEKILESVKQLLRDKEEVTLPTNIFIVGTVNVDETTYMFSPKVLDRAHIIELKTLSPSVYFQESVHTENILMDSDQVMRQFVNSIDFRTSETNENVLGNLKQVCEGNGRFTEIEEKVKSLLVGTYDILEPVNFDFGYRTFKEILDYLYFAIKYNQTSENVEEFMDNAILQKILPKLHGNRRQLNEVIEQLVAFYSANPSSVAQARDYGGEEVGKNNLYLPKSIEKLKKMQRSLENIGYTSFIS